MPAIRLEVVTHSSPAGRMADECPYRKPFRPGFDDCPAYTGFEFVALDLQHRPLSPVLSCRHLMVGDSLQRGGHYPRCRVGDEAAREVWADRVRESYAGRVVALHTDQRLAFLPYQLTLMEAKGRTLREPQNQEAERRLRAAAESLMEAAGAFYREREEELEGVGLGVASVLEQIRSVLERYVQSSSATLDLEIPDDLFRALPPDARLLLRPEASEGSS